MIIENVSSSKIDQLFDELFRMQRCGKYVFRGISKDEHLLPSLFRYYEKHKICKEKMNILEYERWLLDEYGKYSTQYLPSFLTPLDWVANAQHFGLPTRLIDWSFDPFCALYFSLFNKDLDNEDSYRLLVVNIDFHLYSDDIPVFKCDSTNRVESQNPNIGDYSLFVNALANLNFEFERNRVIAQGPRKQNFLDMIKKTQNEEHKGGNHHLFFCSISYSNPRMIAQKGLFQIPRNILKKDDGEYWTKELTLNGCEKVYVIEQEQRDKILKTLKLINITTPRLFPDLQNTCDYLKSEIPFI